MTYSAETASCTPSGPRPRSATLRDRGHPRAAAKLRSEELHHSPEREYRPLDRRRTGDRRVRAVVAVAARRNRLLAPAAREGPQRRNAVLRAGDLRAGRGRDPALRLEPDRVLRR